MGFNLIYFLGFITKKDVLRIDNLELKYEG